VSSSRIGPKQERKVQRCGWARTELSIAYHDKEWGVPVHSDRALFEFLILEGAQAGLSWETILKKRENFRMAFDDFDPRAVAVYEARKVESLLNDSGIIRNRRKIEAAVKNARAFLATEEEFGSFDTYIWRFVDGKPIINRWRDGSRIPTTTSASDALAADLKARGFAFVGSTTVYAHMQAIGMVNDHLVGCFRWKQLGGVKR
jgi:DNA-3-methyladenine glycosylase I